MAGGRSQRARKNPGEIRDEPRDMMAGRYFANVDISIDPRIFVRLRETLGDIEVASDALEESGGPPWSTLGQKRTLQEAIDTIKNLGDLKGGSVGHWWKEWERATAIVYASAGGKSPPFNHRHIVAVFLGGDGMIKAYAFVRGEIGKHLSVVAPLNADTAREFFFEFDHIAEGARRGGKRPPDGISIELFALGYWMELLRIFHGKMPVKNPGEHASMETRHMLAGRYYASIFPIATSAPEDSKEARDVVAQADVASDALEEGDRDRALEIVGHLNEWSDARARQFGPRADWKTWSEDATAALEAPYNAQPIGEKLIVYVTTKPRKYVPDPGFPVAPLFGAYDNAAQDFNRWITSHTEAASIGDAESNLGYSLWWWPSDPFASKPDTRKPPPPNAEDDFYLGYWMEVSRLSSLAQMDMNRLLPGDQMRKNPPQWDDIDGWTRKGEHAARRDIEILEAKKKGRGAVITHVWSNDKIAMLEVAMDLLEQADDPQKDARVVAGGGPHAVRVRGPGPFHEGIKMLLDLHFPGLGGVKNDWEAGGEPGRGHPERHGMVYKDKRHAALALDSYDGDMWLVGYWREVYEQITQSDWGQAMYPAFSAARHDRPRLNPMTNEQWWAGVLHRSKGKKNPVRRARKNPAQRLDVAGEEAVAKYEEFHRYAPKEISTGNLEIPTHMTKAGKAVFVTYESLKVDPETLKKPRAPIPYIHELEAGTVLYLNEDEDGDGADTEIPEEFASVTALTRLGVCLGFAFEDDDGERVEAEGTDPMPELYCTPCGRCLMVVQSRKSVIAMIWGGGLGVEDVGIVG